MGSQTSKHAGLSIPEPYINRAQAREPLTSSNELVSESDVVDSTMTTDTNFSNFSKGDRLDSNQWAELGVFRNGK